MTQSTTSLEIQLETEARRLCRRYIDEVVLRFELCPWAAPALRAQRVQITVIQGILTEAREVTAILDEVADSLEQAALNESLDLVLVVFPRCALDRLGFEKFQRSLRLLLSARAGQSGEVAFALAAFHPEAPVDTNSPERLIPYLRRSPDPLLQAVRTRTLERLEEHNPSGTGFVSPEQLLAVAHGPAPPASLRLRIARANLDTLQQVGFAAFERQLASIHADRKASYERIFADWGGPTGSPAPPSRT